MYAKRYGVDAKLAMKVAKCESEYRTNVYGDSGKAYGVYQFHKPTFELFAKAYGDESMDYKNPEHSIKLALLAISHGEGDHWTCYRKVKAGII